MGDLFSKPPRQRPRVLMHVIDAGYADRDKTIVKCKCKTCGYVSDWLVVDTITEAKRGLPCPKCRPS